MRGPSTPKLNEVDTLAETPELVGVFAFTAVIWVAPLPLKLLTITFGTVVLSNMDEGRNLVADVVQMLTTFVPNVKILATGPFLVLASIFSAGMAVPAYFLLASVGILQAYRDSFTWDVLPLSLLQLG